MNTVMDSTDKQLLSPGNHVAYEKRSKHFKKGTEDNKETRHPTTKRERGSVSQSTAITDKMNVGRRRTLNRIVAGSLIGHPRKQINDSTRLASDATSDNLNRSNLSNVNMKLENTFRVGPTDSERFDSTKVEKAMRDALESRLADVEYDREQSIQLAKELASDIQHRIKIFQWKRYKLVCHVTIGQNSRQGLQVVSRCVWDDKSDSYSCVRYKNKSLFAVAQCYGVYFE